MQMGVQQRIWRRPQQVQKQVYQLQQMWVQQQQQQMQVWHLQEQQQMQMQQMEVQPIKWQQHMVAAAAALPKGSAMASLKRLQQQPEQACSMLATLKLSLVPSATRRQRWKSRHLQQQPLYLATASVGTGLKHMRKHPWVPQERSQLHLTTAQHLAARMDLPRLMTLHRLAMQRCRGQRLWQRRATSTAGVVALGCPSLSLPPETSFKQPPSCLRSCCSLLLVPQLRSWVQPLRCPLLQAWQSSSPAWKHPAQLGQR